MNMNNRPKLEDFYDELGPRGCSTSEYDEYLKAVEEYDRTNKTRGVKQTVESNNRVAKKQL